MFDRKHCTFGKAVPNFRDFLKKVNSIFKDGVNVCSSLTLKKTYITINKKKRKSPSSRNEC